MSIKVTIYLLQVLLLYFHKSFDFRLEKNFYIRKSSKIALTFKKLLFYF